eukprot:6092405-Amphidinium_carterae.1
MSYVYVPESLLQCLLVYVPESLLQCLLEDSRLLQQFEHVWQTFTEEQRYIEHLDASVWDFLAVGVGLDGLALRHKALQAVHIAASYCDWKIMQPLSAYPFCLCLGGIDGKAQELKEMTEAPAEKTPSRAVSEIIDPPIVLAHIQSWSCHRQLLPSPTAADRLVIRLHTGLARLRNRQPQYIAARQCYFADSESIKLPVNIGTCLLERKANELMEENDFASILEVLNPFDTEAAEFDPLNPTLSSLP